MSTVQGPQDRERPRRLGRAPGEAPRRGTVRAAALDILRRWWQWLIVLAVVFGLYLAAAAVDRAWMFWAAVGTALVLAVGTVTAKKARSCIRQIRERLRKYPELEAEVKLLRRELNEVRRQASDDNDRAEKEARRALLQGRSEAVGIHLAAVHPVPVLKAVIKREGQLFLIAAASKPAASLTGALYSVRSALTGEAKGVVRVRCAGSDAGTMLLECRDQWVVPFWENLAAGAEISAALPNDMELARCSVQDIDARNALVRPQLNIRQPAR